MFVVDEATATAIQRAYHEGGELSGIVELRRRFPAHHRQCNARLCVRSIVGWASQPVAEKAGTV